MGYLFIYLKIKEKFHILELKNKIIGQILCENEKFKVFDLSLTRINMPMIEHLMYQKKMVYA
jgi:hypothetical protein